MTDNKVIIGNVEVISVSDGFGENQMEHAFPDVPQSDWGLYPEDISEKGTFPVNFGSFIIRSQSETILVDTGIGPDVAGSLLEEIERVGVQLSEISVVAITHLHFDHVAWNIRIDKGVPHLNFPNARYWIPQVDWEYYNRPDILEGSPHIKTTVWPLEELGALVLVKGETSITGEVTMVPTPGHTPGHMSFAITSENQQGFILGDVANFPFQVQETDWKMSFDNDPDLASLTREDVLQKLEHTNSIIGGGHFMPPSFGRLIRKEERRYWQVL